MIIGTEAIICSEAKCVNFNNCKSAFFVEGRVMTFEPDLKLSHTFEWITLVCESFKEE